MRIITQTQYDSHDCHMDRENSCQLCVDVKQGNIKVVEDEICWNCKTEIDPQSTENVCSGCGTLCPDDKEHVSCTHRDEE